MRADQIGTASERTAACDPPPVCSPRKEGCELVSQNQEDEPEILIEGQECSFCHFAKLKRDGDEIVCPICGYGRRPCT